MHRPTVGYIALVLLTGAVLLYFFGHSWENHAALHSACVRVGIMMGAVWLALPQLRRIPIWLLQGLLVAGVLIAWRPRLALFVIPLLVVYLVLRPKPKRAPTARNGQQHSTGRPRQSDPAPGPGRKGGR